MGSVVRSELEVLQKHLDQLDRIVRLLPTVDFQMVSALVREACQDPASQLGLTSRLAEMICVDPRHQTRPVKVLAHAESDALQVKKDFLLLLLR